MANATFVYAIRGARGSAFRVKKVRSGIAWFIEPEAGLCVTPARGEQSREAVRNPPDLLRGSRRRSEQRERQRKREKEREKESIRDASFWMIP
jgi:hypothetical protein